MKLSGIGYMIAGSFGVIFFSTMGLQKFEDRKMLESGADEALWTIAGQVQRAYESVGIRKDLVIKLNEDTMTFVGGDSYPTLYAFGTSTSEHIQEGELITVQVERQEYMEKRMEAQRGGSNEVRIASLTTPKEELLNLDTYLDWRRRDSLTIIFLMPALALASLALVGIGWKHRKEVSKRLPLNLSQAARIRT